MKKKLHLSAVIWPEGDVYVSRCPEIIQALRRAGFAEAPHRGKGSHRAFFR